MAGGKPTSLSIRWPLSAMRQITIPASRAAYRVLCPKHQIDTDCDTDSLSEAFKTAPPGGLLLLRTGTYRQAATVNTANLHLVAEPGAHLRGASVEGKGAIVVNKDVTIEGLECSHIRVNDGNGCCIRQQHGDVTLIGVHFHHSQMGILTGHNGGRIKIVDSYLHDSGFDESGQLGHNIYVNSGFLEFIRSWSLAAQNAGHEIKSRAAETIIEDSLIASLNSRDSRLIDTPNGGILEVRNSVLGKGPRSENWELIGFGLELKDGRSKYGTNTVLIENNTIYLDRPDGTKLLNAAHADIIQVQQNTIIGNSRDWAGNEVFPSREDARVRPYPNLDPLRF